MMVVMVIGDGCGDCSDDGGGGGDDDSDGGDSGGDCSDDGVGDGDGDDRGNLYCMCTLVCVRVCLYFSV